jgi:hypothetical protein
MRRSSIVLPSSLLKRVQEYFARRENEREEEKKERVGSEIIELRHNLFSIFYKWRR